MQRRIEMKMIAVFGVGAWAKDSCEIAAGRMSEAPDKGKCGGIVLAIIRMNRDLPAIAQSKHRHVRRRRPRMLAWFGVRLVVAVATDISRARRYVG